MDFPFNMCDIWEDWWKFIVCYSLLQLKTAEKRNFLRKGDGRSRISKSKDSIQKIPPDSKSTTSTQLQRPSAVSAVQHTHKGRWMNSSLHNSTMRKGQAKCSEQRSAQENLLRNDVPPHDAKSLALDDNKNSSQKIEASSKQPNQIRSIKLEDGRVTLYGRKVAPMIHLFEERVGFKKVNDRIVRVCDLDQASTKTLSLTTEIKRLLLHSASGDSTSAEDDPKPPTPPNPLRINSDHNLDLSDEDYASDAPSDAGPSECPRAPHCFSVRISSSSGSEDESDSELQQFRWSESHKETNGEATPHCARSSDILARIFPQVKSVGKVKTDNELWEKALKTPHSMNGEDLHLFKHSYTTALMKFPF